MRGAGRGWWRVLSSRPALSVLSTLPPINVLLKAGAPGGMQLSWRGQIHAGGADCLFPGSRWHVFSVDRDRDVNFTLMFYGALTVFLHQKVTIWTVWISDCGKKHVWESKCTAMVGEQPELRGSWGQARAPALQKGAGSPLTFLQLRCLRIPSCIWLPWENRWGWAAERAGLIAKGPALKAFVPFSNSVTSTASGPHL